MFLLYINYLIGSIQIIWLVTDSKKHCSQLVRSNLKAGVTWKQRTLSFPKNKHFFPPDTHTLVYIRGKNDLPFSILPNKADICGKLHVVSIWITTLPKPIQPIAHRTSYF